MALDRFPPSLIIRPWLGKPLSVAAARLWLLLIVGVSVLGMMVWRNAGQPPRRLAEPANTPKETSQEAAPTEPQLAPDLALYREMVESVKAGKGYYPQLKPRLKHYGFPAGSTFNWRLPTYAYGLALLGSERAIQGVLLLLNALGLALILWPQKPAAPITSESHAAKAKELPSWITGVLIGILQVGIITWSIDGYAFYTQEVWSAAFLTLALGCFYRQWEVGAVVFAFAAVSLRELALPWLVAPLMVACVQQRWKMASLWFLAISLFFAYLFWHSRQVAAQLLPDDKTGGGLSMWLTYGGVDFVLLTTRMNRLLIDAPGSVLWLAWVLAVVGLAGGKDRLSASLLLTCLGYFFAYLLVGMPVNIYWGLLFAPALAWGIAHAPAVLLSLVRAAQLFPEAAKA